MTSVFAVRESFLGTAGTVEIGFTDASSDLGDRAVPQVRESALARIRHETGCVPVLMHQIHGAAVWVVDHEHRADPAHGADAMVSQEPGLALISRAADCVPILLADSDHGVIGAVHAGRPGVAAGVALAAVERMRRLGAVEISAWVGPHVCGACYEVPEVMRAEVAAAVPQTYSTTSWGTPALDLGAGVDAQLRAVGCRVIDLDICTREHPSYPSYRRDGAAAGRFAGVIWRAS